MRIAYLCADPGIPVFGTKGASVHVQEVVGVLLDAGHEVELFCRRTGGRPQGRLADAARSGGLTVHELERIAGADAAERERRLMAGDAEMHAVMAQAARERGVDAVYERYALWSLAGTRLARELGVPSILEVNAPLPLEQARHRTLVHADDAGRIARTAIGAASAAVCVSEPVAAWARAQAPAARVVVEPNGVDASRFGPARAEASDDDGPFTVGFVGTLKPWHGTETLLDAFAILRPACPDARLVIVGDGPEREALASRAASLGIAPRTMFTGALDPAEIPTWLARFDVAAAPYPAGDDEAYFSPLKVVEYMAAGVPTVASRVGQLPTLVDDGRTGMLVPGSDADALAAALRALAFDGTARRRIGRAARSEIVRERTWRHVVERTLRHAGVPADVARAA